jgi:hypothetical protein
MVGLLLALIRAAVARVCGGAEALAQAIGKISAPAITNFAY